MQQSTLPSVESPMFSTSQILYLHPRVYLRKIGDHMIFFNPDSASGILFLPYFLKKIYDRINGKRTVAEIIKGFIGGEKNARLFLKLLAHHHIVSSKQNHQEYFPRIQPKKITAWIHITNACNFSCPYCFIKKTTIHMSKEILIRSVNRLIKQAKKVKAETVLFILAGGEPLLRSDEILYLVNRAKKQGRAFQVITQFCIISNGSLLTDNLAKKLKKEGVILSISIDSWFEQLKPSRVLTNGIDALPLIKRGIDIALRNNILQAISITITKENIKMLPQTLSFFLKVCPDIEFHFNMYFQPPIQKIDMKGDDRLIIKGMKKAYRILFAHAEKTGISPLVKYKDLIYGIDWFAPKTFACNAGTEESIVIMHDGKIRACPAVPKIIGTINDPRFLEHIQHDSHARLNATPVSNIDDCGKCLWMHMCGGGCQAERINQKQKKPKKSRYCNVYKALIPYLLFLEGKRLLRQKIVNVR